MKTRRREEIRLVDCAAKAYQTARREVFDVDASTALAGLTQRQVVVLTILESAEMDLRAYRAATRAGPPWPHQCGRIPPQR
jgi:hypothetical protein